LCISARIFDPIGFLAPTVLLVKIIYQQLWEKNKDWDQMASVEIQRSWKTLVRSIIYFNHLKIHRWIGYGNTINAP
jgi:hypothetical protein